jgi:hypothetical protein
MGTKINLYKQSGTDDGTSVNFNVPRSLTYGLNARANDDGGVTESDNCEYNTLNGLGTLLKSASLVVTPNSYKEGKLYSVIPNTGAGDMSVTRATTATRVNSAGLVELVPYNLLSYSNAFNTAPWSMNVTSGQAGKDGQNNAWLLTKVTATSSDFYNSNVYNGDQTFTIYVKKESGKGFKLYPIGTTTTSVEVNLQTGAVLNQGGAITSTTVEAYSSTWWKISVALNMINSGYYIYVTDGAGTQIASSITIQDAQVNIGLTAKPYFPTTDRLNIPRLDYSNGTCPSLLVEPQRTNVLTYSSSFDDSSWLKANASVTSNNTISPSGVQDADLIIEDNTNNGHVVYKANGGTSNNFSFYAKPAGRNWVAVLCNNSDFTYFNISNGTLGTIAATSTATIEDAGNGWYRCSVYNTHGTFGATIYLSTGNNVFEYTGNGTSGIYVWGAQLEAGSYATSYIPTTSASVTRNADFLTRAGFGNTSTSGTLFFDFYAEKIESSNGMYMLQLFAGSSIGGPVFADTNGLSIIANGPAIQIFNNRYSQQVQTLTPTQGQRVKIAVRYNGTNVSSAINGTLSSVFADTAVGVKNALRINNCENGTQAFNAVAFFPSYLNDDQLELLTGTSFNTYAEMASYYNYTLQ